MASLAEILDKYLLKQSIAYFVSNPLISDTHLISVTDTLHTHNSVTGTVLSLVEGSLKKPCIGHSKISIGVEVMIGYVFY